MIHPSEKFAYLFPDNDHNNMLIKEEEEEDDSTNRNKNSKDPNNAIIDHIE